MQKTKKKVIKNYTQPHGRSSSILCLLCLAVMNAADARSYCVRQGSSTWSHCQRMNNFTLRLTLWHSSIAGTLYLGQGALKRCSYKTTCADLSGQCVLSQHPFPSSAVLQWRSNNSSGIKTFLLQWTLNLQPHTASLHTLKRWIEAKIREADPAAIELDSMLLLGCSFTVLSFIVLYGALKQCAVICCIFVTNTTNAILCCMLVIFL